MKIRTPSGIIRKATINNAKGGAIIVTSEMEPHALVAQKKGHDVSLKGPVILAKQHEIDLLIKRAGIDITISPNFMPTDIYKELEDEEKSRFWMDNNPGVTINPSSNEHMLKGGPVTVDSLLEAHNQK